MNFASEVAIDGPAEVVWDVFTDVVRWPEWTRSVTEVVGLDGPQIEVGRRFAITQPRLPKLVWTVTEVTPGVSWAWRSHSLGATTTAVHELVSTGSGPVVVRQRIEQRGPLAALSGLLMGRLIRRYLAMEGAGLQGRIEGARHSDGSAT